MKFLKYIFIIVLIFTSCKTTKNVTDTKSVKGFTSKKLIEKHLDANFNTKTVTAKFAVKYKSPKDSHSFSVKMKIKKDEVIYFKGTKFITVFKAKITQEKVEFYSPLTREYFDGDFSMLRKFFGVDINFQQLQNMLLGHAMLDVKNEAHDISFSGKNYQLSPKKQSSKFDIFYFLNPNHFKLDQQTLVNPSGKLDIAYPKYIKKSNEIFPEQIKINAKGKVQNTQIELLLRSVDFGTQLNMPFKIPAGYKKIKL